MTEYVIDFFVLNFDCRYFYLIHPYHPKLFLTQTKRKNLNTNRSELWKQELQSRSIGMAVPFDNLDEPPFGSSILEPRLDLSICHFEQLGKTGSFT
ncbi:hypothetical protein BpHYR1_012286 [Brachionus plicatilis]|uniref:Uncharacterized protein n=1 Tax=Brachionus plicatilis TaxID=10195 RepID=A0A3M7PV17_BRAPC|nr:hypothetical protein BpHYR1_012286 [Brachionus plicatilis]